MSVDPSKRIIDYIIEQAERTDGENIKIEERVMERISNLYDQMERRIMMTVETHGDIDTVLKYQNLMNRISGLVGEFYSAVYKTMLPEIGDYTQKGYHDFQHLIEIGHELQDKAKEVRVTEIAGKKTSMPDPNAIEFMKNHAFEQVKAISNDILSRAKAEVGALLVSKKVVTRAELRKSLQKILDTSRNRADTIAQTELSMAYNRGALQRMDEFNRISGGNKMRKYWHGFKYSATTCPYCRPRIGNVYAIDDNSEMLPAHPRCRCVWLPFMEGWDTPINTMFTSRANMLNRVYQPDEIYKRLDARLGINYSKYLPADDASRYMAGDRSSEFYTKLAQARDMAIKDTMASFDIASEKAEANMAREFNIQMPFWKRYVSEAIADKSEEEMLKSVEAIKAIMILPWSFEQLDKWNKLLNDIQKHL